MKKEKLKQLPADIIIYTKEGGISYDEILSKDG